MEEEEEEEGRGEGDEDDEDGDGNGEDEDGGEKKDGMADMMSKILHQSIPNSNPVLAKRKTVIMREMEEGKEDRDRLKRQRMQRKAEKEKQLVVPDAATADYESQLRKLATRGVVSLFNAISAAKREEAEAAAGGSGGSMAGASETSVIDVKRMTQENFLELLKDSDGRAPTSEAPLPRGKAASASAGPSAGHNIKAAGGSSTSWSALRDDYALEKEMTLKNWDRDDSGDDEEDGGASNLDQGSLRV